MTRKYQVFISSSFIDLHDARLALLMATLREGHIPFGMEMLRAGARRSIEVIEQKICESDIFVVLVGARLGTRIDDKPDSLTFTESEYELALQHGLPVITFLLNDAEYERARDAIPADHEERRKEDQLRVFRERVKKIDGASRIVGYFSYNNIDGLCDQYSHAVADCVSLIDEGPRGGWVPGEDFDVLNNRIHLDRSVSDNPFFRDVAQALNRFEKLSKRTKVEPHLKVAIASYFWQRYFAKLHTKRVPAVYFESGSSIAYASRAFIECVRRQSDWWFEQRMNERVRVLTNNILTYLDFLLQLAPWKPMDVRLNPPGPVSDDYGGTYGTLNFAVQESAPSLKDALRTALHSDTQKLVDRVAAELGEELKHDGLVLMTASGVDTQPESKDAPYPGPHVGSYANMLLKRSLLSLPCPKVLFIHPGKWGFDFRFNNCHAVCDQSFPWDRVRSSSPLAIALATESQGRQQQLADELAAYGFTDIDLEEVPAGIQGPWSVIAANQAFAEFFAVTRRG
jgi:hypothetical protein